MSQEILDEFEFFTHIIVTSPNTAHILHESFGGKKVFAIGEGTAAVLKSYGVAVEAVAKPESQEGMIELLEVMDLKSAYLFYPRSSMARPLLREYLERRGLKCCVCDLYETVFVRPKEVVDFVEVSEIVFTSPSTVRAFVELYGRVPEGVKCTCIGPVTARVLGDWCSRS
jgi:uroporphyrinogen-III synthase